MNEEQDQEVANYKMSRKRVKPKFVYMEAASSDDEDEQ